MPYLRRFGESDIFTNTVETQPQYEVVMYSNKVYINHRRFEGQNIPDGTISLYEANSDRSSDLIHAYVVKDGNFRDFGPLQGVSTKDYVEADYGTRFNLTYPLTSSVARQYVRGEPLPSTTVGSTDTYFNTRKRIIALQNTLEFYRPLSPAYQYSNYMVTGAVNLISIPSIMFDSGIQKGSVDLKFYFTGTLVDRAIDKNQNGELISTMGELSGTTVGVVLYNEGFVLLTSSYPLSNDLDDYKGTGNDDFPRWTYFGAYYPTGSVTGGATGSLYSLSFKGTNKIPTVTMFAEADAGKINNSQNSTWLSSSAAGWRNKTNFNNSSYVENKDIPIKNTLQSQYCKYKEQFEKQVFISSVGIFDDQKNLIGVAKLANPVKKKESDSYTFKLKLDF